MEDLGSRRAETKIREEIELKFEEVLKLDKVRVDFPSGSGFAEGHVVEHQQFGETSEEREVAEDFRDIAFLHRTLIRRARMRCKF